MDVMDIREILEIHLGYCMNSWGLSVQDVV